MATPAGLQNLLGRILRRWLTGRSRARLPVTSGRIALPGPAAEIEVRRDPWGVPHVYAASIRDLFFAQGFVHAQDRFWQMELNRRTAAGRLAEMVGAAALDTDRLARVMGWGRLGGLDLPLLPAPAREVLEAYADGVNAWLDDRATRLPVECFLLRHRPEPWTPADSLAFARLMMWMLSHSWSSELVRAAVVEKVGAAAAAEIEPAFPDAGPAVLPAGSEFNALDPDGSLRAARGPFLNRGRGSNSWAVAGRHTVTGRPFLCNDVHLQLAIPSVWYECHLEGGGYRVAGASIAGLPFVLAGHNARLAWGVTLAFTDAEDLFVEEFDPADPRRVRFRGGWEEARVRREEIRVKGVAAPRVEEVVETRHGPIVSDVVPGAGARRLALASTALRPGAVMEGWRRLNLAADWDGFLEALRLIEAPQLAMPYADVDGNIGFGVTGRVPVRAKGRGLVPAPGWDGEHEWAGEVAFEEMPHALNPASGRVVTANHRLAGPGYPHFLGAAWMNGWRAARLEQALGARGGWTAGDFAALQQDVLSLPAREVVAALAGARGADALEEAALALLRAWDCRLAPDSAAASVYAALRGALARELLEPALGPALTARALGAGTHPMVQQTNEWLGHDTALVLRMLASPESSWVRGAGGRDAWIARSLRRAVAWLRDRLGPDPAAWRWGRIHRAHFHHALAARRPLDIVFGLDPAPVGGDSDTVMQTMWNPEEPWEAESYCPTWRAIYDLSDWSRSRAVHAPGQSGHLGSPHYDDQLKLWARGEHHPMLWERVEVVRRCEEVLVLEPA